MSSPRSAANRERAESFGSQAADYDLARPRYPAALIDDLVAPHPVDVLDVGCGTGILARALVDRGVAVTGVEVDDRMAEVARAQGLPVETAPFETWPARGRSFDLIVSGQAWHWVDADVALPKTADLLRRGGRLALCWNFVAFEPAVEAALDAAYERAGAAPTRTSVLRGYGPGTLDQHAGDVVASGRFGPVERREYRWSKDYTRAQWVALISTHSDHSTLAPELLAAVRREIGAAIDALGGVLHAPYRTLALVAPVGRR